MIKTAWNGVISASSNTIASRGRGHFAGESLPVVRVLIFTKEASDPPAVKSPWLMPEDLLSSVREQRLLRD